MERRKFLGVVGLAPFFANAAAAAVPGQLGEPGVIGSGAMNSVNDGAGEFFYRPQNAWAADFIPFYDKGEYHLFYLLDWRDMPGHGEGTPWYRISTKDFVNFTDHGQMLERGTKDEQDLYVFTGSVIKAEGRYHIFYTGHNPHFRAQGKPEQGVMHAVSDDLDHWTKVPEDTFYSTSVDYEKNDWRDPFVYWNEKTREYEMLLAARYLKGIPRRKGLTALCSSKDLVKWRLKEPLYAPDLYYTHECPDLFMMGDWWYLVFSEFTELVATRYRMSRSPKGPWITPERDCFDGHAFYAAKTASDGKKRFIFGWNPTRREGKDNGGWDWGGNLVVHEVRQAANGELTVRIPDTVAAAFTKSSVPVFKMGAGNFKAVGDSVTISADESFGAATAGKLPEQCMISMSIDFRKTTRECGIVFRTSDDLDTSYYIKLEPVKDRLVFDKWPRERAEVSEMVELQRPVHLQPGTPVDVKLIIDGNKGVVYINNTVAMNFRCYDFREGNWGVFATDGIAAFKQIRIATL